MEWFVGVFVLLGLVMLGVIILAFGQFQERFRPRYDVKVFFPDASGLLAGADVKLGGAKVGTVGSAPELNDAYDGVVVTLRIFNDVKIPDGSAIAINQSGLLGDSFINIRPPRNPGGGFIDPSASRVYDGLSRSGAGIDGLQDTATQVADRATLALAELERTLQTFNKTLKRVDESLLNDSNIARFTSTMDHMAQASEKISSAADKLSPLLEKGDGTLTEARDTLASTRKVMEDLQPAIADLSPALKELAPALREIRPAVAELKPALAGLQPALKEVQSAAEKTSSTWVCSRWRP
ncbi:MAG: MlaD family protein [Verrucomicrobiota bacterium]